MNMLTKQWFLLVMFAFLYLTTVVQAAPTSPPDSDDDLCKDKINLLFIVDKSASIKPHHFVLEKKFLGQMIDTFYINYAYVRVSILLYGNFVVPQFDFNNYTEVKQLQERIPGLTCGTCGKGKTATGSALKYGAEFSLTAANGARAGAKNVVVLITDGKSTQKREILEEGVEMIHKAATAVVVVGVGNYNMEELRLIATAEDLVFTSENFSRLESITQSIANKTCEVAESGQPVTESPSERTVTTGSPGQPVPETTTEKPVPETTTEKPVPETTIEKPVLETNTENPVLETTTVKPVPESPSRQPQTESPVIEILQSGVCNKRKDSCKHEVVELSNGKTILCDTHTDGGGWIVFQRYLGNSSLFLNSGKEDYIAGFGQMAGPTFWMGLDNIHGLCNHKRHCELRVEVTVKEKETVQTYKQFFIAGRPDNYTLSVSGWQEGDGFNYIEDSNGQDFMTKDDISSPHYKCLERGIGAWWFTKDCAGYNGGFPDGSVVEIKVRL